MKNSGSFLLLAMVVALMFVGCRREYRPDGLPKLHPCTVTVTQEGKPLTDATVKLFDVNGGEWPVSGLTDAAGVAKMVTYGQFDGAPAGEYKVIVVKRRTDWKGKVDGFTPANADVFSLIELSFAEPETSTLTFNVEKGRNTRTFEVGKPVEIIVDRIRPGT